MVNPLNPPVTPEQREFVARGRRQFMEGLSQIFNVPIDGFVRMGQQWEEGMLRYLEEPLRPIQRDVASLSRRILGREPARWLEMQRVADELSKAPIETARKIRHEVANLARLLGIEVRREL